MLRRVTAVFVRVAQRYMPDPFLFSVLLTFVTFALALAVTPHAIIALLGFWYDGLWKILSFAMQMILILLTGYTLANSSPVRRFLGWVAGRAHTPAGAAMLVVVAAAVASLINWGFGLVVSALLAREIGRRVRVDFAFLVAAAYSGFVVWASGLSSSIALVSATAGSPMNVIATYTGRAVTPVSETLLAPYNLVLVAASLVLLPVLFRAIVPPAEESRMADPTLLEAEEAPAATAERTPAARIENSRAISLLLATMGAVYAGWYFRRNGFAINLDILILVFFVAGLILHGRPIAYARAFNQAAHVAGPLALQYPLYGGIMGLMVESGLAGWISNGFVAVSSARTLPLFSFVSSLIITLFVPSGGGHWVVQGPFMIPAAVKLGVAPSVTAMAVAYGEQTGNMLQPFWALPILAIARMGIRDIMGYCVMTFLLSAVLSVLVLWLLA